MIFKLLISLVLIGIPGCVYYYRGFNDSIVSALVILVFLCCAILEEVRDLKIKK